MKKGIISFLILLLTAATSSAQRVVTGIVVSAEDSTAVPGATVRCLSGETATVSTVTDGNGAFQINNADSKECTLQISFVGFDNYTVKLSASKKGDINLGQIPISPKGNTLEEITVKAGSRRIDRSLVFPTATDIKVSYDIYSLLRTLNLHGMTIDEINKNVRINGKNVQWKINNVPKTDAEVKNIKPKDILRVEYSDIPSMRELDKGYGGVVNIILKEKTEGGYASINGETAFTTGFANGGATLQYNKGKSSLKLDYSVSLRDYDKWKKDEASTFISPEKTIERDLIGKEGDFGYTDHNLSLNYTLQPDNKTQFSVSLRNNFYSQDNSPEWLYRQDGEEIHRSIHSTFRGYVPSVDIFFSKILSDRDMIEADVVGTMRVKGRSRHTLTDIKDGDVIGEYSMPADSKRKSLISELFYTHIFNGGHTMSLSVQNTIGCSHNDYYVPEDYRDKLDENNTYAYVRLWGKLSGKVQYSIGAGLKYNHLDNGTERSDFWRNQSSASLAYSPNDNIYVKYSMLYYPTLPTLYAMTSVAQRFDDLQVLQGNPSLKAAQNIENIVYMSYAKNKLNVDFTVSFNHVSDPIFLAMGYDTADGLFTNSYINGRYNNHFDINCAPSLKGLFNCLNLLGTVGYSRFWAKTEDTSHTLGNFYWNIGAQLYYKRLSLSAYYMQPRKTLYNETVSTGEKSSRITLMWQGKKVTAYAAVYNPFTPEGCTYADECMSKYNPKKSKVSIPDNANMFVIGCSIDLDFDKPYNKRGRRINNSDNGQSVLLPAQ